MRDLEVEFDMSGNASDPMKVSRVNKIEDGKMELPVTRSESFVRYVPNVFSLWKYVDDQNDRFTIYIQYAETKELKHIIDNSTNDLTKQVMTQIVELASLDVSRNQLIEFKNQIDSMLAL